MIRINNNKFINGELVSINDGRLQNLKGFLVGVKEEENIALVKIGFITNEVELEYIEKIEHENPKLFIVYTETPSLEMIYKRIITAKNENDLRLLYPDPEIQFLEIDEVDGFDVVLQKMATIN